MAAAALASPPPTLGGGGLLSLGWGGGACNLQLSSAVLSALPPQAAVHWRRPLPRPALRLHRELHIHRYLPDGRPWTYEVVDLPDRVCEAGRLCSPRHNARAVFADMARAMEYGGLPYEALQQVMGTVLLYVRDVAELAVRSGAAPLPSHVWGALHVHVMGDVVSYGGGHQLPSLLQTAVAPMTTEEIQRGMVGGQLVDGDRAGTGFAEQQQQQHQEEEEEGDCCAICLEGFASGGGDRRWLPCSHGFHGECVGRWLLRKAECPLCRRQVEDGEPALFSSQLPASIS